jgi:hypothetical protein
MPRTIEVMGLQQKGTEGMAVFLLPSHQLCAS